MTAVFLKFKYKLEILKKEKTNIFSRLGGRRAFKVFVQFHISFSSPHFHF